MPRGRLRAVGVSAAFLISGLALAVGLYGLAAAALSRLTTLTFVQAAGLQSAATLVAFGLATWVFGFRIGGLGPRDLRWTPGGRRGFFLGLALGLAPAVLALVLAVPAAGAGWQLDGQPFGAWPGAAGQLTVFLLPAALVEEVVFRGVALVLLAEAFGRATAIVGLAVLFAFAHVFNPGATPLALGNIALAGVFLGTVFYLPGGLWTATGAHLGWNATLAALAAPVSGLPFAMPWLDYHPGGPAWVSGGAFGPEGGLTATLVLAVATMGAARLIPKEMHA